MFATAPNRHTQTTEIQTTDKQSRLPNTLVRLLRWQRLTKRRQIVVTSLSANANRR